MFTASGSWEIINTTRYNTEDIVRVFDRYEVWLQDQEFKAQPARKRETGQVKIGDYSPSTLTYQRNRFTPGGGMVQETVHCYVRGPHIGTTHVRDVGLVKPSKLYTEPLEALSAPSRNGVEVVPDGFVRQFVLDAVSKCYTHYPGTAAIDTTFDLSDLHIRVMRRRESNEVKGGSRAAKVSALQNKHRDLYWGMHSVLIGAGKVDGFNAGLDARFEALQLPRELRAELLVNLHNAVDAVMNAIRKDSSTVGKEAE